MYIYMYIYVHMYFYLYIYIYTYMFIYKSANTCECWLICQYLRVCLCWKNPARRHGNLWVSNIEPQKTFVRCHDIVWNVGCLCVCVYVCMCRMSDYMQQTSTKTKYMSCRLHLCRYWEEPFFLWWKTSERTSFVVQNITKRIGTNLVLQHKQHCVNSPKIRTESA